MLSNDDTQKYVVLWNPVKEDKALQSSCCNVKCLSTFPLTFCSLLFQSVLDCPSWESSSPQEERTSLLHLDQTLMKNFKLKTLWGTSLDGLFSCTWWVDFIWKRSLWAHDSIYHPHTVNEKKNPSLQWTLLTCGQSSSFAILTIITWCVSSPCIIAGCNWHSRHFS